VGDVGRRRTVAPGRLKVVLQNIQVTVLCVLLFFFVTTPISPCRGHSCGVLLPVMGLSWFRRVNYGMNKREGGSCQ